MNTIRAEAARKERAASASLATQLAELEAMTTAELAEKFTEVFGFKTRTRHGVYLRRRLAWAIQASAEGGLSQRALDRIDALAGGAPVRWRLPATRAISPTSTAGRAGAAPARAVQPVAALPGRPRDARLPPIGTVLTRVYQNAEHSVTVLADGFEYRGARYRSLTAVARVITSQSYNGFGFWNLLGGATKTTEAMA